MSQQHRSRFSSFQHKINSIVRFQTKYSHHELPLSIYILFIYFNFIANNLIIFFHQESIIAHIHDEIMLSKYYGNVEKRILSSSKTGIYYILIFKIQDETRLYLKIPLLLILAFKKPTCFQTILQVFISQTHFQPKSLNNYNAHRRFGDLHDGSLTNNNNTCCWFFTNC